MKILFLVFSILCVSCDCSVFDIFGDLFSSLDDHREWSQFKEKYNRSYESIWEDFYRKSVYFRNKEFVETHNALYENGETSYSVKLNRFADLTGPEHAKLFKGFKMTHKLADPALNFGYSGSALPNHVDWREKNVVTPVKNQLNCGSCWAFSATGSMEGQHALKTKKLVSLSEQNLVDCSRLEGNHGCDGGDMDAAFNYTVMNHGIDTEESYPYKAKDGNCQFKKENVGATFTAWVDITRGDEKALQEAVANKGPISVGIDAAKDSFQFYHRGIYDEKDCSSKYLDHGVLAVGYGTDNGNDYWLVKNSWGSEDWGEGGYIRMSRNKQNQCGIATCASFPEV